MSEALKACPFKSGDKVRVAFDGVWRDGQLYRNGKRILTANHIDGHATSVTLTRAPIPEGFVVVKREVLLPFVRHADETEDAYTFALPDHISTPYVTLGECRALRQALATPEASAEPGLDWKLSPASFAEIEKNERRNVSNAAHLATFVVGSEASAVEGPKLPRYPDDRMVEAGLYHSSADTFFLERLLKCALADLTVAMVTTDTAKRQLLLNAIVARTGRAHQVAERLRP